MGKSLSQKTKKNYALADAMLCVGTCNALRWHMQCFALAHAKLCEDGCKALRFFSWGHVTINQKGREVKPFFQLLNFWLKPRKYAMESIDSSPLHK